MFLDEMPNAPSINWTNASVRAFAKNADPLTAIEEAARTLVLKAREKGWEGPPFNPLRIAELLEVQIEANSSVADARLVATERGPKIEFNPQQPRERVRFSIAHEIAHLLFPDWSEQIRNRGGDRPRTTGSWKCCAIRPLRSFICPRKRFQSDEPSIRSSSMLT